MLSRFGGKIHFKVIVINFVPKEITNILIGKTRFMKKKCQTSSCIVSVAITNNSTDT